MIALLKYLNLTALLEYLDPECSIRVFQIIDAWPGPGFWLRLWPVHSQKTRGIAQIPFCLIIGINSCAFWDFHSLCLPFIFHSCLSSLYQAINYHIGLFSYRHHKMCD